MIDNYIQRIYFFIAALLMSIMIVLMGLLFFQYTFLCSQVEQVLLLKQQYYSYIDEIQNKLSNKIVVDLVDQSVEEETRADQNSSDIFNDTVMTVEEFSQAESSDEPDDDDEYIDDSAETSLDVQQWDKDTVQESTKRVLPKESHQQYNTDSSVIKKQASTIKKPIKDCGLSWPIENDKFWLSSLYGPRKRINGTWGFHHGIDMAAMKGTVVKAARGGKVVEASFQSGYGNTVVIQHTSELKTRYAHLHTIRVSVGQVIKLGMIVGTVGETGFVRKKGKDGSHLHFEVYEHGKRINPLHCLPRSN